MVWLYRAGTVDLLGKALPFHQRLVSTVIGKSRVGSYLLIYNTNLVSFGSKNTVVTPRAIPSWLGRSFQAIHARVAKGAVFLVMWEILLHI